MRLLHTGSTLFGHKVVFAELLKTIRRIPSLITKENEHSNLRSTLAP
jgi:hypothetical protein